MEGVKSRVIVKDIIRADLIIAKFRFYFFRKWTQVFA